MIKPTTIMFHAEGPEANLGKAKQADIGAAKFKKTVVKNGREENGEEEQKEDSSPIVLSKAQINLKKDWMQVECEEDDDKPLKKQKVVVKEKEVKVLKSDSDSDEKPKKKVSKKKASESDEEDDAEIKWKIEAKK